MRISMTNTKPFSNEQYDKDDPAKLKIISYLQVLGGTAWVNPDPYGIDILASFRGRQFAFEVEVKHNWSGGKFPYESVHISARKLKFVTLEPWAWFVLLNHELEYAILIDGKYVRNSPIITKHTKYSSDESFVEINRSDVEFRTL